MKNDRQYILNMLNCNIQFARRTSNDIRNDSKGYVNKSSKDWELNQLEYFLKQALMYTQELKNLDKEEGAF